MTFRSLKPLPLLLALLGGTAGGAVFHYAGLPAAWLTGSMIAVGVLALTSLPVALPQPLAFASFILIGISMGAGINADLFANILNWPLSLIILALSIPAIMAAVAVYLRRFGGWSDATAFFSSIPGALSYVVAMTIGTKADTKLVVMAQMVRLMILMAVLPPIIVSFNDPRPVPEPAVEVPLIGGIAGVAVMLAAGGLAGLVLHRLKVPAGLLLGAMIASAALHLSGIVAGQLPNVVLVPSLIVLGAYIGLRFEGASFRELLRSLPHSFVAFLIALIVASLFALATWWLLGVPLGHALLAFAPGGLEAMIILSFLLDLDPAYVAAHQFARFLGISFVLPFLAKRYAADAVAAEPAASDTASAEGKD